MRYRLSGRLLQRSLLRPAPLLAFLAVLASAYYYLGSISQPRPEAVTVEIGQPQEQETETAEVRLVVYDSRGLAAPTFVTVELPSETAGRIEAVLSALREQMLGDGWPDELPVPTVFVEDLGRQSVAVLDLRPPESLALSVGGERRLQRSIEETVLETGVDSIRYLLRGESRGVFLEHLAVPTGL